MKMHDQGITLQREPRDPSAQSAFRGRKTAVARPLIFVGDDVMTGDAHSPRNAPHKWRTFLDHAAGMSMAIRLSVLMLLIGGALPFVISLILVSSHQGRQWPVGAVLLVLAAATFVLQIIENSYWLSMLSVSETYRSADAKDGFEIAGIVVRSGFKWAHYSHILVVIGWLFTLYLLCFRTGVVPRVLAVAGMVGCVLHFGGIILPVFAGVTMPYLTLFGIPLALATVLAAGWLLARGMTSPHSAVGSCKR